MKHDNRKTQGLDNLKKDTEEWKTGGEPATEAQKSYLHTLNEKVKQKIDFDHLSKADASDLIGSLRRKAGITK